MSGISTGEHPYRSPCPRSENQPKEVEIETNDLAATISYRSNNEVISNIISFKGTPRAKYYSSNSIDKYEEYGSSKFKLYLQNSHAIGMYQIGSLYIPAHMIISIDTKVTKRTQIVYVKER